MARKRSRWGDAPDTADGGASAENGDAENQEQQPGGNQEDQQVNPGAQASTALAVQQATQAILGSAGGAGQVEQIAQMLLANAAQ